MTRYARIAISSLFLTAGLHSCTNHDQQTLLGGVCDTSDTKFSTVVNPIITAKCVSCHNNSSSAAGISLEGYSNIASRYQDILRTMNNGSMPKNGDRIDACSITKIATWVNRGKQNN